MAEAVLSRAREHHGPASVWREHRAKRQNSETERQVKKRTGIRNKRVWTRAALPRLDPGRVASQVHYGALSASACFPYRSLRVLPILKYLVPKGKEKNHHWLYTLKLVKC